MPDFKFWNERWLSNQIGFHMINPHSSLVEFIDLFSGHRKVFVPLCGKSPDLIFLRNHGLEVIGIEFSEIAIKDFIKENNLNMKKNENAEMNFYEGEGVKIFQGDIFKLSSKDLSGITCCYDRASMVAFNEEERIRYADLLINKAQDLKLILAPLFDYGDILDAGPPYSVTLQELNILYGKNFELLQLKTSDLSLKESKKSLGATYEREVTWKFTRKQTLALRIFKRLFSNIN